MEKNYNPDNEGLPYQSLVTCILHKYTTGKLIDIDEARKILHVYYKTYFSI